MHIDLTNQTLFDSRHIVEEGINLHVSRLQQVELTSHSSPCSKMPFPQTGATPVVPVVEARVVLDEVETEK